MKLTIDTTDEQYKAMTYVARDPIEWIQNAWDNRARQAMDEIIQNYSDKQPGKLVLEAKLRLVRETVIETADARHKRLLTEMFRV